MFLCFCKCSTFVSSVNQYIISNKEIWGMNSYVRFFSNPIGKFRFGWCKACIFSRNFHVRKDVCFAPSEA
jgi:hypothetical protein